MKRTITNINTKTVLVCLLAFMGVKELNAQIVSSYASFTQSTSYGLAFDASGNLYASYGTGISKISSSGTLTTFVSSGLNSAKGIAFDASDNLYVVNNGNNTVSKVSSGGTVTSFISTGLNSPYGIAIDASGNIYVSNSTGSTISKYSSSGSLISSTFVNTGLSSPRYLICDKSTGNLYVSNVGNSTVSKITSVGVVSTVVSSGLNNPVGLTVDAWGNLYISDQNNSAIKKVATGGTVSTLFTNANGGINNPIGITFDAAKNNLFIINRNANNILKAEFSTTSSTNYTSCDSYTWNGSKYISSGTYNKTFTTANSLGFDSIATLNLTINTATSSSTTQSACGSYTWNGITYSASGSYSKTGLVNSKGCDSTANLNLTINVPTSSSSTQNVCSNQFPYIWNGLTFNTSGTQTKTGLVNAAGCDSSATLTVTVGAPVTPSVTISTASTTVCSGNNVSFTASASNGGSSPNFNWKRNGSSVGSGSSITFLANTLSNNDVITCELTANNACQTIAIANSNSIQLTVNATPSMTSIVNSFGTSVNTASMCSLGGTARYYNNTPYGVWSSNNTSVANVSGNGTVTPNTNGTVNITYTVTTASGCSASSSLALTVAQATALAAITGLNKVCAGATIPLSNSTPNGVWSTGQTSQATVNASTGVVLGKSAGTATIDYTVINAAGCSATVSKAITVNALPAVPLIGYAPGTNTSVIRSGSDFCNNKTFTVVGNPTGGVWSKTGVISVTSPAGEVTTGNVLGAGSLTYTLTNANGCSNSRTMNSNVVSCAARGINNEQLTISNIDFTMYPNPARTFISLNVNTLIGKGSIVIADLYGKTVKTQPLSMGANTINTSSLSKGMYLVSVITNEGKSNKKLIIE